MSASVKNVVLIFVHVLLTLDDIGCEVALAVRWPGHVTPGRVVEDFVNLMDLAPTFCEAGVLTRTVASWSGFQYIRKHDMISSCDNHP